MCRSQFDFHYREAQTKLSRRENKRFSSWVLTEEELNAGTVGLTVATLPHRLLVDNLYLVSPNVQGRTQKSQNAGSRALPHPLPPPPPPPPPIKPTIYISSSVLKEDYHYPLSDNEKGKFVLNSSTGVLELISELDYEDVQSYTLMIHARDNDNTGNVRFAECIVYVTVIDVNDNSPTFGSSHYDLDIDEDITIGFVVFTFAANDPDGGLNGLVSYNIVSSNDSQFWNLNSSTGELRVAGKLTMCLRFRSLWLGLIYTNAAFRVKTSNR